MPDDVTGEREAGKCVYLLTSGDGSDGDEWSVVGIFTTMEAAQRARVDYTTWKAYRPDGTFYHHSLNEVEEWPLNPDLLAGLIEAKQREDKRREEWYQKEAVRMDVSLEAAKDYHRNRGACV